MSRTIAPGGGIQHNCTVADGNAYCWGGNGQGQLGNNSTATSLVPVAAYTGGVLSGKPVTAISASTYYHTCAIASGAAYCWGNNANGQLGNNSTTNSSIPVTVNTSGVLSGKTVTAISGGAYHTCAVANGAAYCWGYDSSGVLGNNSTTQSTVPVAVYTGGVLSGKNVTDIAVSTFGSCAIADGKAYCWGTDAFGWLGDGGSSGSIVPVAVYTGGVLSGKTVTAISMGDTTSCVIANGAPYCWGSNNSGQLGNNSTTDSSVPVAVNTSGVLSGKTVTSISAGLYHTCAIADGNVYCWGRNTEGELGNNSTTQSNVPVAVSAFGS